MIKPSIISPQPSSFSPVRHQEVTYDVETMAGSEDSKIKNLIATIILCTTLSTLSFIGRLRGRLLSAVRLGWDDLFMALAVVCMLHLLPVRPSAYLVNAPTSPHG